MIKGCQVETVVGERRHCWLGRNPSTSLPFTPRITHNTQPFPLLPLPLSVTPWSPTPPTSSTLVPPTPHHTVFFTIMAKDEDEISAFVTFPSITTSFLLNLLPLPLVLSVSQPVVWWWLAYSAHSRFPVKSRGYTG